jgi:hypothetical protein
MPDLYLHPDGDALLVDPQGKLTADPACCCDAVQPYDAIVIDFVYELDPDHNQVYAILLYTDASANPFGITFVPTPGKKRIPNVFTTWAPQPYISGSNFAQAAPACSICNGLGFGIERLALSLNTFIPRGSRTLRIEVGVGPNDVGFPRYIAAHIYTAQLVFASHPYYWHAIGKQTLLCLENPTLSRISAFMIACESPFTRP